MRPSYRLLSALVLLASAHAAALPPKPATQPAGAAGGSFRRIERAALIKHVEYLASPEMRGRDLGSPEEKRAAEYIRLELSLAGLQPPPGWTSPIQEFRTRRGQDAQNVVFALRGRDGPTADEWIVIGAHFDHLGVRHERVYPGADDNASGTAGVIEIAKAFAARRPAPARSLLFCFFTGEERGFVGSSYLVNNLPVPETAVVAMLNADMISRDDTRTIHIVGTETAEVFRPTVVRANEGIGLTLKYDHPEWLYQSDHLVFYRKRIPILYFGVEDHVDYHQPTDTADKIDADEIESVARLIYRATELLADSPQRPTWAGPIEMGRAASRPAGVKPERKDENRTEGSVRP